MRLVYALVLLSAACAAAQTAPALPGTYGAGEPLPPPLAPAPGAPGAPAAPVQPAAAAGPADPGGDADFADAKSRFESGADPAAARATLEAFVDHHPQHPARPAAELMLARLALLRGDAATAGPLLEPLTSTPPEAGVASSARYYLGLAETRLGHFARARELLLPFLPPAGAAGPGDEALVELRGALALATAGAGDAPAAIELWDAFARGGRDAEKAYARAKVTELAGGLSADAALQAFRSAPDKGLARALLGPAAAATLRARGDSSGASEIEAESLSARRSAGIEMPADRGGSSGDPSRVGLELALSGKFQPVGEAALRAAMLATGAPGASNLHLFVRDSGGDVERAARGIGDLAREQAVIGIVAAVNPRLFQGEAGAAALAPAADEGVPTLTLEDTAPGAGSASFQLVHPASGRAAALAQAALKLGARDFALIGPDTAAGTALRRAFKSALVAGGGRVGADVSYPPGSTSFGAQVAAIKKAQPQVVFVADGSDRLELIAPALAAADLWSAPWGAPRPAGAPGRPKPRNVLLLSTAADLSPRLLQSAGRYVQGALLAPGFYAGADDPRAAAFVQAYRTTYGQDPHVTEAYAYDGVNAIRTAVAGGARTRGELARALSSGSFEGLTGALRFGPDHGRADPPRLYVVQGDDIKLVP
ncbi:MAG TPA: ABC transporter substrate-binding protein [Polyangia bacterium]|nr:ABC transporter substrate-binding protein [Polyangia bacterium]